MTGYGKAVATLENGKLTVEIRSVNGKNADISIKSNLLPKDKELGIRKKMAEILQRGTIDMFLTWEPNAAESAKKISRRRKNQMNQNGRNSTRNGRQKEKPSVLLPMLVMPGLMRGSSTNMPIRHRTQWMTRKKMYRSIPVSVQRA